MRRLSRVRLLGTDRTGVIISEAPRRRMSDPRLYLVRVGESEAATEYRYEHELEAA